MDQDPESPNAWKPNTTDPLMSLQTYPFPSPGRCPSVKGNFGAKITMILRHIKYLIAKPTVTVKGEERPTKVLVFSTWDDVLNLFAKGLLDNEIPFVRFETGSTKSLGKTVRHDRTLAVQQFQSDPNVKVFILNAKSQSSGLTLTVATHVILVEPNSTPATEMQAIARVHRLGQTAETWVHRYIISDSVEIGVDEICRRRRAAITSSNGLDLASAKRKHHLQDSDEGLNDRALFDLLHKECVHQPDESEQLLELARKDRERELAHEAALARANADDRQQAQSSAQPVASSSRSRKPAPIRRSDLDV
jgi:hypothetical protein